MKYCCGSNTVARGPSPVAILVGYAGFCVFASFYGRALAAAAAGGVLTLLILLLKRSDIGRRGLLNAEPFHHGDTTLFQGTVRRQISYENTAAYFGEIDGQTVAEGTGGWFEMEVEKPERKTVIIDPERAFLEFEGTPDILPRFTTLSTFWYERGFFGKPANLKRLVLQEGDAVQVWVKSQQAATLGQDLLTATRVKAECSSAPRAPYSKGARLGDDYRCKTCSLRGPKGPCCDRPRVPLISPIPLGVGALAAIGAYWLIARADLFPHTALGLAFVAASFALFMFHWGLMRVRVSPRRMPDVGGSVQLTVLKDETDLRSLNGYRWNGQRFSELRASRPKRSIVCSLDGGQEVHISLAVALVDLLDVEAERSEETRLLNPSWISKGLFGSRVHMETRSVRRGDRIEVGLSSEEMNAVQAMLSAKESGGTYREGPAPKVERVVLHALTISLLDRAQSPSETLPKISSREPSAGERLAEAVEA